MEVLISTFVLSIGLLGLASLLPVGRLAVVETNKSDYSGACGRAGLHEVEVRQMLHPYTLSNTPTNRWVFSGGNQATTTVLGVPSDPSLGGSGAFAIDPLGVTEGMGNSMGPATDSLPRVNLVAPATGTPFTSAQAQEVFLWKDDVSFTIPDNARTRRNFYMTADDSLTSDTADFVADNTSSAVTDGNYSWLATAVPAVTERDIALVPTSGVEPPFRQRYNVSVAVCHRRLFQDEATAGDYQGEQDRDTAQVSFVGNIGYGGGTIELTKGVGVKDGEWILLYGRQQINNTTGQVLVPAECKWYRVVSAAGTPATRLTLQGPDWTYDGDQDDTLDANLVVIPTVIGVYSTVIEVDNDPVWSR